MSVVQKEIKDQIIELEEEFKIVNDSKTILQHLAISSATVARSIVKNASETKSIDERIEILVSGLQSVVNQVEEQFESTTESVDNIKIKIKTLSELLEKIILVENDEKKNN
jgi:hypothetical protein